MGYAYSKKSESVVYLRFKFNWVSRIFSGNPIEIS